MIMAREDVMAHGALPVPLHLRNAPTPMMKKLGYGEDYRYPHDFEGALVDQSYLPEKLEGRNFYAPTDRGYEIRIREFLERARRTKTPSPSGGEKNRGSKD
jgi:putative ATPase